MPPRTFKSFGSADPCEAPLGLRSHLWYLLNTSMLWRNPNTRLSLKLDTTLGPWDREVVLGIPGAGLCFPQHTGRGAEAEGSWEMHKSLESSLAANAHIQGQTATMRDETCLQNELNSLCRTYQDFCRHLSILSSSEYFLSPQRKTEGAGAVTLLVARTALEFLIGITKLGCKLLNNQMMQDVP